MPRPATGQVVVDKRRRSPTYGLRFRAYGQRQYITLGTADDGWTQTKAQTELQNVLADVRRGIWRPNETAPAPEIDRDPTFHEFASQWFDATKSEWRPKTVLDYEWQLSSHLLPFFGAHYLSQITIAEVDRYRLAQVRRGKLSATSINKTITRLGQVLEVAVEYGLIERNPAKGRRRRLKAVRPTPVWLDRAEHIEALLDAAGELDRHAKTKGGQDQKGRTRLPPRTARHIRLRRPAHRRADSTVLARRGPGRQSNHGAPIEDRCRHPPNRHPARPPRRAERPQGAGAKPHRERPRLRHRRRHRTDPRQHPPPRPRQRRGEGQREARRGGRRTAPRRPDTPQAAPHLRLDPRRPRRRSRERHGPARPHRPRLHPACLSPRDATRRHRKGQAKDARRFYRFGSNGRRRARRHGRTTCRSWLRACSCILRGYQASCRIRSGANRI
jgi:Phage integrase central domain